MAVTYIYIKRLMTKQMCFTRRSIGTFLRSWWRSVRPHPAQTGGKLVVNELLFETLRVNVWLLDPAINWAVKVK